MPAPLLGHGKDAHAEWGQRYLRLWSQRQSRFAISRTTNGKATAGRHPSDPGFSPIRVSAAAWFTTAPSSLSMRASGGRRESPGRLVERGHRRGRLRIIPRPSA